MTLHKKNKGRSGGSLAAASLMLLAVVLSLSFGGVFGDELTQEPVSAQETAEAETETAETEELPDTAEETAGETVEETAGEGDPSDAAGEECSPLDTETADTPEETGDTETSETAADSTREHTVEYLTENSDAAWYLEGDYVQIDEKGNVYTDQETFVLRLAECINGEKVTALQDNCLRGSSRITAVIIPECITEIGDYAFADCRNLEAVILEGRSDLSDLELGRNWSGGAERIFEFEVRTRKIAEETIPEAEIAETAEESLPAETEMPTEASGEELTEDELTRDELPAGGESTAEEKSAEETEVSVGELISGADDPSVLQTGEDPETAADAVAGVTEQGMASEEEEMSAKAGSGTSEAAEISSGAADESSEETEKRAETVGTSDAEKTGEADGTAEAEEVKETEQSSGKTEDTEQSAGKSKEAEQPAAAAEEKGLSVETDGIAEAESPAVKDSEADVKSESGKESETDAESETEKESADDAETETEESSENESGSGSEAES